MNEIETEDFNLCVDSIAGFPPGDVDQNKIGNMDYININGWVIDEVRHCDPHNLLIKIGDTYSPTTMSKSWDVDNVFDGNGCYANSRFSVSVSTDALRQNGWQFSYYIINNDRTGYYVYDSIIPSIEVTDEALLFSVRDDSALIPMIMCSADTFSVDESVILIGGWAYCEEQKALFDNQSLETDFLRFHTAETGAM